jgi:N-acetyl-anhydromuramyl-L-alanine amidase AmpD
MLHDKILLKEQEVRETGINGELLLKEFEIDIPGEPGQKLKGFTCRPSNGFTGYFYDEKVKKERIALHHTAGYLKSDLRALMSKQRGKVSTNFVIARDGTIYQLFSSAAWSYHMGRGALGGNKKGSSSSIGVELSNFGWLVEKGDELHTIYGSAFCKKSETDLYTKLDQPYRGHSYYAGFPDAQINSLIVLMRYLNKSYKIPMAYLPENVRYLTTQKAVDFKGVVSHVNFRTEESGKWDLGPAFPWKKVIEGTQAESFSIPRSRGGILAAPAEVSSVEGIEDQFPTSAANAFDANEYGEDGPDDELDVETMRGLM